MRLGVVLGNGGGWLQQMHFPFKLGIFPVFGKGQQFFPWIHLDDLLNAIQFFMGLPAVGVYNLVAPQIITQLELMQVLAQGKKFTLIIKIPATFIHLLGGQLADELLLSGSAVYPEKLLKEDYHFTYENISSVIKTIN